MRFFTNDVLTKLDSNFIKAIAKTMFFSGFSSFWGESVKLLDTLLGRVGILLPRLSRSSVYGVRSTVGADAV